MVDSTGRKSGNLARQATEDLQQSEELFRLLVASVREYAIFMLDPGGHVMTWNAGAERLKGYSAADIVGQHFSRFYPPEVPRSVLDRELEVARDEGQFRDEGWRIRKDGSRFWADVTITAVRNAAGVLRGFAKVTRDMTSAKLAEQQKMDLIREQTARAEAERANRMKDGFLATLSHELRTPLNAIVGWADLLESGTLDPENVKKAVSVIRRNASAQNQLVSDILDLSRISAGKIHLRIGPVELDRVVQAALDTVTPAANARSIRITPLISSDASPVSGDPDRLQQVVWNLLSNAVKFTPKGGRVEVRVQRVNSHVEIVVQDTGPGVSPEFVPYLFEPFQQADATPTRRHGGLGLGLSIARHLAELHGGSVRVANAPAGGAVFTVELPMLAVQRGEGLSGLHGDPCSSLPSLYGVRVLVVEDDEDARTIVQTTLEGVGAQVELATGAAEGLALLRKRRPDVLLSDVEMPEQSGYDLVEQVRRLPAEEGGLVPAIALTAHAMPQDRIRALSAGFQLHMGKPIHPSELVAAVAALTARTRERPR